MKTAEEAHRLLLAVVLLGSALTLLGILVAVASILYSVVGVLGCVGVVLALVVWLYLSFEAECIPVKIVSESLQKHVDQCPSLNESHRPAWWASGFLNSVAFAMFAKRTVARLYPEEQKVYIGSREMFKLSDGGQVALDWSCPPKALDDSPIILFLHGVVGHGRSNYLSRCVEYHEMRSTGWRICARSWRGIDIPLASPKPEDWSVQATQDSIAVVRDIKRRYPKAPLFLQGMSVGSGCVINCLGEADATNLVVAALAVSGPGSWVRTMDSLARKEHAMSFGAWNLRVICGYYAQRNSAGKKSVFEVLEEDKQMAPGSLLEAVKPPTRAFVPGRTFFDGCNNFHDKVTTRYTGHASHKEYFETVDRNIIQDAQNLQTPTLCMIAQDDPVTPINAFFHQATENPMVVSYTTKYGGHCGWFTSLWHSKVDDIAFEWFSSFM